MLEMLLLRGPHGLLLVLPRAVRERRGDDDAKRPEAPDHPGRGRVLVVEGEGENGVEGAKDLGLEKNRESPKVVAVRCKGLVTNFRGLVLVCIEADFAAIEY